MIGKRFISGVSILMLGTAAAQLITFLLSFVLTRLYDSAEYGHYSIFIGCGSVLAALSTGSFEKLIVLVPNAREARRARYLVMLTAISVALFAGLLGIVMLQFEGLSFLPLATADIFLLPIFAILFAIGQIFVYQSLQEAQMARIAVVKVGQSLVTGVFQVALSGLKAVSGLALGYIAGLVLVAGACIWYTFKNDTFLPSVRVLLVTARRHHRYPRYVMPNEVVDILSNQAPLFLIGMFLSLGMAGYYSLAMVMLSAPATLVGKAVGQSFFQYIGRQRGDPAQLRRPMILVWLTMGLLGIVPFVAVFFFGDWIFALAFGERWTEAGVIAGLLAPMLLVRFASSPTSGIYLKLQMQRQQWYFVVAAACYRVAAYALLIIEVDLRFCILVHVAAEIVSIFAYNAFALRKLKSGNMPKVYAQ